MEEREVKERGGVDIEVVEGCPNPNIIGVCMRVRGCGLVGLKGDVIWR